MADGWNRRRSETVTGYTAVLATDVAAAADSRTSWLTPAITTAAAFALMAIALWVVRIDPLLLLAITTLIGVGLAFSAWENLIAFMLVVGFFAGSIRFLYGNWTAYAIPDGLVALVLVRWVTGRIMRGQSLIPAGMPVALPFGILVAYALLEFANPEAPALRTVFGIRSLLMYTLLLFAGYDGYEHPRQIERLSVVVIVMGVLTGVYGIWQWQQGIDSLQAYGGGYSLFVNDTYWTSPEGEKVFRAPSTFVISTMFAGNMAIIALLAIAAIVSPVSSRVWKVFCLVGIPVMGGGIAASGSRLGPAYLAMGLLIMLGMFGKFRVMLSLMVGLPVSLWLTNEIGMMANAPRFALMLDPSTFLWKWFDPFVAGVLEGLKQPLGQGLGYVVGLPHLLLEASFVDDLASDSVVDSGYGAVGAELGLPGLLIFIWFVVRLSFSAVRGWRRLPSPSRDLFFGPAVWAAAFLPGLFILSPYAAAPSGMYHWIFFGMLLRAPLIEGAADGRIGPTSDLARATVTSRVPRSES